MQVLVEEENNHMYICWLKSMIHEALSTEVLFFPATNIARKMVQIIVQLQPFLI